jgi:hypothetical protein
MRLYVPHDERRPQPEPAATNDALAFAIGIGGWLIGLAVVAIMLVMSAELNVVRVVSTIGVGLLLGALGMLVSLRARRR